MNNSAEIQRLNASLLRLKACKVLADIAFNGRSANELLPPIQFENPSDTSFFKSLVLGASRQFIRLETASKQLLQKPFRAKDADLHCLIILGLYQLEFSRVPDHAAISETVDVCEALKKPWAKKLINGVLRNYLRQQEALNAQLDANWDSKFAFPDWLINKIKPHYKGQVDQILQASNQQAPMTLRVNLAKINREDYLQLLEQAEITASAHSLVNSAIVLESPCNVTQLPNFEQGRVSVQDAAAQISAELLISKEQPKQGMQVLDACAAPGGKSAHLLEHCDNQIELTAVDIDPKRCLRIQENLERLELCAELVCSDILETQFEDGQFDAILLDVPCSATGVIRRHPDIKLLRRASDIDALVELQQQILRHLWPKLKAGGRLLYATCSILPDENSQQIEAFLAHNQSGQGDAKLVDLPADLQALSADSLGCQLLPDTLQMDGFYYCLLEKATK